MQTSLRFALLIAGPRLQHIQTKAARSSSSSAWPELSRCSPTTPLVRHTISADAGPRGRGRRPRPAGSRRAARRGWPRGAPKGLALTVLPRPNSRRLHLASLQPVVKTSGIAPKLIVRGGMQLSEAGVARVCPALAGLHAALQCDRAVDAHRRGVFRGTAWVLPRAPPSLLEPRALIEVLRNLVRRNIPAALRHAAWMLRELSKTFTPGLPGGTGTAGITRTWSPGLIVLSHGCAPYCRESLDIRGRRTSPVSSIRCVQPC
mmetsp:Transcript_129196/g.414185  ORF Transcript_129196/g.414185 Transcript_129196/m.414185 type:complete len:261 (-) Transcript_129196:77-859(-)